MAFLSYSVPFVVAFAIAAITVPLVRRYAHIYHLGNKPNGRRVHASAIPHLGGIGITLGIFSAVALYAVVFARSEAGVSTLLRQIAPGVSLIVILGLIDDLKSLKARQKLLVQIIAASTLVLSGFQFFLGIPGLDNLSYIAGFITVFYLVGIINSLNLVDGHDGLAAGMCCIASAAFATLALMAGAQLVLVLTLATAGACLAFLMFNFPPAKIFMGDTGSMMLGMILGLVTCLLTMASPSINTMIAVCFVLALPILDTWLAIARRIMLKVPVFRADCRHIHHTLSAFGFSPRQTLFILYTLQTLLALLGVFTMRGFIVPIILGSLLVVSLFLFFLKSMVVQSRIEQPETPQLTPESLPELEKIAK